MTIPESPVASDYESHHYYASATEGTVHTTPATPSYWSPIRALISNADVAPYIPYFFIPPEDDNQLEDVVNGVIEDALEFVRNCEESQYFEQFTHFDVSDFSHNADNFARLLKEACEGSLLELYRSSAISNPHVEITGETLQEQTNWVRTELMVHKEEITSIDLSGDFRVPCVPPEIFELTSLSTLVIRVNRIRCISDALGNLTALTRLNLSHNKLTCLPDTLGSLYNLRDLEVSRNPLSRLPDSIGNLAALREIGLTFNLVTALPTSFGALTGLTYIVIDESLIHSIPAAISNRMKVATITIYVSEEGSPATMDLLPNEQAPRFPELVRE